MLTQINGYRRREQLGPGCLRIEVTQGSEELLEFDLNAVLQCEWIQTGVLGRQLGPGRFRDARTGQQALSFLRWARVCVQGNHESESTCRRTPRSPPLGNTQFESTRAFCVRPFSGFQN